MSSEKITNNTSCKKTCITLALTVFKRTAWVPAVWSVILLVAVINIINPFGYMPANTLQVYTFEDIAAKLMLVFALYVISIAISAVFGAVQFSYLNRNSSAGFISALPLTRTQTFFSCYLSGIVSVVIPQLVMSLPLLTVQWRYSFEFTLMVFAVGVIYSVGVYSFGVMMSRFSGHTLGGILFTLFGLAFPVLTECFIRMLMTRMLYGYYDESEFRISEFFYLLPQDVMSPKGFIYVAAIAIFTVCAWLLYKNQHFELAGDLIAFRGIRGIATIICGTLAGVIGYLLFNYELFMFALFGVICGVLVNFAVKKHFYIKSSLVCAGAMITVTLVISAIFGFDITGFESRIPEIKDIDNIRVYGRYNRDRSDYYVDGTHVYLSGEPYKIKDEKGIATVRELHGELIGNKNYYYESGAATQTNSRYGAYTYNHETSERIVIEYNLKNGKTMKRTYTAYRGRNRHLLRAVNALPEMKTFGHPLLHDAVQVTSAVISNPFGGKGLTDKEAQMLHEAIKKDILAAPAVKTPGLCNFRSVPIVNISFDYIHTKGYDENGKEIPQSIVKDFETDTSEPIYAHYTETIAAIRMLGLEEYLGFENYSPSEYSVCVEKHNCTDGKKTYVYHAQYVDDNDFVKKLMEYSFSVSGDICEKMYDTAYRIVINDKNNSVTDDFFIYGKADFIEMMLSGKDMTRDPSATYNGYPYYEEGVLQK